MECLKSCVETSGWWALLSPVLIFVGYQLVSRFTAMVPPDYVYTTKAGGSIPVGEWWHNFWGNGRLAKAAVKPKP